MGDVEVGVQATLPTLPISTVDQCFQTVSAPAPWDKACQQQSTGNETSQVLQLSTDPPTLHEAQQTATTLVINTGASSSPPREGACEKCEFAESGQRSQEADVIEHLLEDIGPELRSDADSQNPADRDSHFVH